MLGLVPWGALLACSFLLTGLIIYLVHASKAASQSIELLDLAQSENTGYPHRVRVFAGSYPATAGLASGAIVGAIFLALTRLRQKLAHEKNKGERVVLAQVGHQRRCQLAVVFVTLLTQLLFPPAERWGRFTFGLLHNLGILSFCVIFLPLLWFGLNVMFLCAWSMALWTLRDSAPSASIAMQQTPSTAPANISLLEAVQATNMVCPTGGCYNLNMYAWLESNACLCNQQLVAGMQDLSRDALASMVWALGGVGCLLFGALIASAQGAADLALLKADWNWGNTLGQLRGSPVRRPPMDPYDKSAYAMTPGDALPKRAMYPAHNQMGGYYIRSPAEYAE